jgi:thiosulfate/3-mercaptopyruvate sulfurtransferase
VKNLLSAAALSELITGGAAVRLLDVRWQLGRTDGHEQYLNGHLPGAVYVDLQNELSSHGEPSDGRHPLPSTDDLQAAARRWGLRTGDMVVVYDDAKGISAARAWWLLRKGGVDVRLLDGGLRAWIAAGQELQTGDVISEPGDVELADITADSISIDQAAAFPASGVLLDVRAPERYRGETEPYDPVAGHIPGALSLPTGAHLAEDGTLLDLDTVRANFAAVGVSEGTPVAMYCGSGVTAAHSALVLSELGIDAKVFPGSWSQWSNTPGRPIATGALPGGGEDTATQG